ncbi:phytanoyl-CoA dioxygenase family protein [Pontibacter saemangeumensis]|uniref:Phytanoyl-CoA dioxygenase family protein n=1 Tax=Pontibacter saemangeumensis TaxID=1084525 RepID=A0ABP8LQF6_9BACT
MRQVLNESQIQQFIQHGYVRLEGAFPRSLAEEGRRILWKDTGCGPKDPTTWTQPVVRLGDYAQEPFDKAVNTPMLHAAFDQLVGAGRWLSRHSLGTFPVRFPGTADPGDAGWHVDASFPGEDPADIFSWRVNVTSKGRALLMLFLFSDVAERDAPTRIRAGSHLDVARLLAPHGAVGLSFMELADKLYITAGRQEVLATGEAGTVYLCHPFLAHAAQAHHGETPRFMAQPPLCAAEEFELHRADAAYAPVETAIRKGIGLDN